MSFVSPRPQCSPRLRLGEHWGSRGNKTHCFPCFVLQTKHFHWSSRQSCLGNCLVWKINMCEKTFTLHGWTQMVVNSHHLARKYARIFVCGHYLFREANSFPRAKLEENCELRGTDNILGQISEHIFATNGDYCLYYPSNLFRNARSFQNSRIFPSFSWGVFGHVTRLGQSRVSKKIWWITS